MLVILYWVVAILLMATVLVNLGYSFAEAVFMGTMFLPGALAAKYFFSKIDYADKKKGISNLIFVILGIMVVELLLCALTHLCISAVREVERDMDLPEALSNPVFIAIMITIFAVGDFYYGTLMDKLLPTAEKPVSFMSERKEVSLFKNEILFVESNDYVTTIVATDQRKFKNSTPISHWETILGATFIRIHRSYLINRDFIDYIENDTVTMRGYELPVSRKHKEAVLRMKERMYRQPIIN